jgi:hypothetical protein
VGGKDAPIGIGIDLDFDINFDFDIDRLWLLGIGSWLVVPMTIGIDHRHFTYYLQPKTYNP